MAKLASAPVLVVAIVVLESTSAFYVVSNAVKLNLCFSKKYDKLIIVLVGIRNSTRTATFRRANWKTATCPRSSEAEQLSFK